MTPPIYKKRNGPGRRADDLARECPFHEGHDELLKTLGADMKQKIGLKTAALMVSILLIIPGINYLAISRYVETATKSAVDLLRVHITKSEKKMEEIGDQLDRQNSTLRIMNYRLNQLDRTPESHVP